MINLKRIRTKKNLTMKRLGEEIGVAESTISLYEAGKRQPDQDTLKKLASFLNVSTDYLLGITDNEELDFSDMPDNIFKIETRTIPMLGSIAAGEPIYAEENFEFYVKVGAEIKADFCLTVKGDSMVNARINDGDLVFIRKQSSVNDGEIAAVLIDNEATLKRVYIHESTINLVSENPAFKPMIYSAGENDVKILGKAVAFQSDVR